MTPPQDQPAVLGPTERSLPIALLRAREAVMEPVREMLSQSRISEQKWRVLRVVAESGPVEQTVIASRACLLLPSLTRIIRSMEADGLLSRKPGEQDRRKSFVTITDKGLGVIDKHAAQSVALFRSLEKRFGKDNLDALLDLLDKLQKTPF